MLVCQLLIVSAIAAAAPEQNAAHALSAGDYSVRVDRSGLNIAYREAGDVRDVIGEADIIYLEPIVQADYTQSRVERSGAVGTTPPEFQVTGELMRTKAKRSSIVLHSLPRMDELTADVDETRHQRYWVEASNGVSLRMALLALVLGSAE